MADNEGLRSNTDRPGVMGRLVRGWVAVAVAAALVVGQLAAIEVFTRSNAPSADELEQITNDSREVMAEVRAAAPEELADRAERNREATEGLLSRFRDEIETHEQWRRWLALPVWMVAGACLAYGGYLIADAVTRRRPARRRAGARSSVTE